MADAEEIRAEVSTARRDMFAPTRPSPHSVAKSTGIVIIGLAVLLVSRALLHAQDIAVTNPLVSAYLVADGITNTMMTGSTLQFTAHGSYPNHSVIALPNSKGDGVIAWNTGNRDVAAKGATGHATTVGTGPVNIEAVVAAIIVPPLRLTAEPSSAPTTHTIPSNATSSGDLSGSDHWTWSHDSGTPGEAVGSSQYPVASPSLNGESREFYMSYAQKGGERFSLTFGQDPEATHFVYDAYLYLDDPTQLANLEMDINQVTSDGETVIYAVQCSGYSGAWEFSTIENNRPHWHSTSLSCSPRNLAANTWHHIQIASHRSSAGVVTYDWVNLDETYKDINNATGNGAVALHWATGVLNLNFQLDGASESRGSIRIFADKVTVYYW